MKCDSRAHFWLAPSQAFALVASPRLRLRHFTFWSVVVGGLRWSDMEKPCVQLCTMTSSQCGWPNGPSLTVVLTGLQCSVGKLQELLLC